ncbi:response regulator [Egicoccus sp. AB-alg2]|uniref:response regulator n=1 Tax=Egicoccus sp. AB-alg2 TaxID=3242693 RepID=UPI00359E189D
MIRVVIADDQNLIRGGLRAILDAEADIEVVAEVANGLDAATAAATHQADVVLMDVQMPDVDGISGTRTVLQARPDCRVVILTMFDLDEYVVGALRAGASGFLLKTTPPADLADAVRACHTGEMLFAPTVTRRLVETYVHHPPASGDIPDTLAALTPREIEVLRVIARGLSNAEIAAELYLGEATVKTHVTRIFAKLGLRDRVQAVVLAYETGLVSPGEG